MSKIKLKIYKFMYNLTKKKNKTKQNTNNLNEHTEPRVEEAHETVTTARPRRLSEITIKKTKKPIPRGSAFFIFSHTNR